MKKQNKGFIFGFLLAFALMFVVQAVFVVPAEARTGQQSAVLNYTDIKLCVDGQLITPKDANGSPVEPFAIQGTTYLPVRAIGEALGKPVDWDSATHTVYIGQKPTGATGTANGTLSNPFLGSVGGAATYHIYYSDPYSQVRIKVLNTITGDTANYLAAKLSSSNKVPNSNQEWVFFELEINYVTAIQDGEKPLELSYVLNKDNFFKGDGSALGAADSASVYDAAFISYNPYSEMYPGGTSKTLVGLLVNKGYDKILLNVPNHIDYKTQTNTWIYLNDVKGSINSVDELKTYFGIDEESSHENDPIKITLRNTLPMDIANYSGDTREAEANITDFSYTVSGSSVKITFTGQKTYDSKGFGQSRQFMVGWKLYDSDGYVIKDGTAYSTSIKFGEKFKNCEDSIYSLEPGEYTLEIMGVN